MRSERHPGPVAHIPPLPCSCAVSGIPDLLLKHARIFEYKVVEGQTALQKGKARIQVSAGCRGRTVTSSGCVFGNDTMCVNHSPALPCPALPCAALPCPAHQ